MQNMQKVQVLKTTEFCPVRTGQDDKSSWAEQGFYDLISNMMSSFSYYQNDHFEPYVIIILNKLMCFSNKKTVITDDVALYFPFPNITPSLFFK